MLIAERVLGKDNEETTYTIKHYAATYANEHKFDQSLELLLHAVDNISSVFPFKHHICSLYSLLQDLALSGIIESEKDEPDRNLTLPRRSQCFQALESAISDFQRGERSPENDKSEEILEKRLLLLRIILNLMQHVLSIEDSASLPQDMIQVVSAFLKTGVRGPGGNTLLHMACDASTGTSFDTDDTASYKFPQPELVQLLLKAGSDVSARNEASQTALQVLQEQEGDHTSIVKILEQASQS